MDLHFPAEPSSECALCDRKVFYPLVVGFVMSLAVRLRLLAVPPSFWVVRSLSSLKEVQSSFVPPEPSLKENVRVHTTWEEWEELSSFDSAALCVGCQRPVQQRKSTKRANSGSNLHHTPAKRRSRLPLAKRFGECRWTTTLTAHCHLSPFLLFSHSMSHYSTGFR